MTPLISVITACYNHGKFLDACCSSVQKEAPAAIFEHVLVNDGSTDELTLRKCAEWEKQGVRVIHQKNEGLAAARNAGIRASNGKYILPLDSDNLIEPKIFIHAAQLMEANREIDVVYSDCYYFGDVKTAVSVGPFNLSRLLFNNYIDACALIRKETLERVGFYDERMPGMGNEDWELWVRMAFHECRFHYLRDKAFHYRVQKQSMVSEVTFNKQAANRRFIFTRHAEKIADYYAHYYEKEHALDDLQEFVKRNTWRSLVRLLSHKILRKLKASTRLNREKK